MDPVSQAEVLTPEAGIPSGITRDDVLDAIQRLDARVDHAFAASMKYDVVYNGLRYAPKAVIGLAADRLAGRQLGPRDFKGGQESQCFRILEALGFTISEKETAAQAGVVGKPWRTDPVEAGQCVDEILRSSSAETRLACLHILRACISFAEAHSPDRWLLTLHRTHVRFIAGMVMCLQYGKGGNASLLLLKSQTPADLRKNAGTYENAPGCVEVYLPIKEFHERYSGLLIAHQSAIRVCLEKRATAGGHRRAHAPGLVTYLERIDVADVPISLRDDDAAETAAVQQLWTRIDIGPTEKQALVNARRGQGLFRDRVIALERKCRVTEVNLVAHLRASHIKPWRVSTDNEKLDGNNGLLLAPHIDHLFDQGYISFTDEGELLVSPACPIAVLEAWGLTPGMQVGRFRKEQRPYLADHRKRFKFESK